MIRFACITMLILLSLQGFAQRMKEEELFLKRGMMGVSVGPAFPILDFADDNFKLASGYATTGYNVRVSLCYDVSRDLGLAVQYHYMNNPFNSSEYLKDIKSANQNSGFTFNSFKSKPWTLQGLMIGVYYPFRAYRTTIDLKVMGGLLAGVLPENTFNFTDNANNRTLNVLQYESGDAGFGVQVGLNFRYQLHKKLLLLVASDFTYSEIEYTNITIEETSTGAMGAMPNYTQYYHIINISAGLGIQFN